MKAIFLTKTGVAKNAFEQRETPIPEPKAGEVLVKVQGFGLNFADVMARKGQYQDAPPLPSILGYDVCGFIESVGADVKHLSKGNRVAGMTRFGGYAEYAVLDARACVKINDSMNSAEATALATQYCTAYYSAAEVVNLHKGDKVLIHAAAGGVGTALVQYCKHKGCEIFGTAGSEAKLKLLKENGVHHPINYTTEQFDEQILKLTDGKGVDVIFDSIGASYFKKGIKVLAAGGRIVGFGAADMSDAGNIFVTLKRGLGFGIYHPAEFLMSSKALIGVNMLRIADNKPEVLQRCFENVIRLYNEKVFQPVTGKIFKVSEIADAHEYLEMRKSIGKIAVEW